MQKGFLNGTEEQNPISSLIQSYAEGLAKKWKIESQTKNRLKGNPSGERGPKQLQNRWW